MTTWTDVLGTAGAITDNIATQVRADRLLVEQARNAAVAAQGDAAASAAAAAGSAADAASFAGQIGTAAAQAQASAGAAAASATSAAGAAMSASSARDEAVTAKGQAEAAAAGAAAAATSAVATAKAEAIAQAALDTQAYIATGDSFAPAGTGAVSRSVRDKLRDVVSVRDFGALGDGTTDDTAAFRAAVATGKVVYVPAGTYRITGDINNAGLRIRIQGEGWYNTKLACAATATTYLRIVDSDSWVRDIQLEMLGQAQTAGSRGISVEGVDVNGFMGEVELSNALVRGFDRNIHLGNAFAVTFRRVYSRNGNYGFFCAPADVAGDNGYVTTIFFDGCYFSANVRNFHLSPALTSPNVRLRDTVIEAGTGTNPQAYFANCQPLLFDNCYLEGVPGQPVLRLVNCQTTVQSSYFNATGGINLGAGANSLAVYDGKFTSATDIITATGTSDQSIRVTDTSMVGTPVWNANPITVINSTLGGAYYANQLLGSRNRLRVAGTSEVSGFQTFTHTIGTLTVAANTTAFITNGNLAGVFDKGAAFATPDRDLPGVIFTVTPVTAGGIDFWRLNAVNTTGAAVVLTGVQVRIVIMNFSA